MNALTTITPNTTNETLTMSSKEIADLVEKRHDNVKRTIETLANRHVIGRPQIEDDLSTDLQGKQRTTEVYHLPKRDTFVVVAQLSPEFTARIVDRWQELEEQAKVGFQIPTTFREALLLAAAQQEKIEQQAAALIEAQPKVEVFEKVVSHDRSIVDVARMFEGVNTQKVKGLLQDLGYLYRNAKGYRVYARFRDSLFKEGCEDTYGKREIFVLPKGYETISDLHKRNLLPLKVSHRPTA